MKVRKAARYALRNRWTPTLGEIVRRTIKKHMPDIVRNVLRNNGLFSLLTARG